MTSDGRNGELEITSETDISTTRKVIRNAATDLGFGLTDVTRIVTVASELARNIFRYAGSGNMRWNEITGGKSGIELIFEDSGPGIANLDQAMEPGYTSGGGLGMGLSGAKRLMDEMEIHSEVGKGTMVTVKKLLGK